MLTRFVKRLALFEGLRELNFWMLTTLGKGVRLASISCFEMGFIFFVIEALSGLLGLVGCGVFRILGGQKFWIVVDVTNQSFYLCILPVI